MWANCAGSTGRASTGGCGHESTTSKREVKRRDSSILRLPHPLAVLAVTRREGAPPPRCAGMGGTVKNLEAHNGFMYLPLERASLRGDFASFKNLTRSIQG